MPFPHGPERRPWPRAPRYLVGSDGSIVGPRGPIVTFPDPKGYLIFGLWENGRLRMIKVHIAVCETFHGPRPSGHHAAHDNGVKIDCSAENVQWKTPAENAADKRRHGTENDGERNGRHKLTVDQVREIRASREPARVFAERFGVSKVSVRNARTGRTWGRVS